MTPTDLNVLKLEAGGIIWAIVVGLSFIGCLGSRRFRENACVVLSAIWYPFGWVCAAVFGSVLRGVLGVRGDNGDNGGGGGGDGGEVGDGNEMVDMESANPGVPAAPAAATVVPVRGEEAESFDGEESI
ncbi:hypothetical protein OCU04_011327 [Sclerotinia nivalis]|uniref:Uncharacterized protein n=1 Tax=Sclerotinia nivalis TaxID=352851 RepID=A0A9X0AC18_9HELO|nr:hypothetical protein OCU04_011327 [Sclerotinia nivalis]